MSATELLASLQQRGVLLCVDGDRLRVDAPTGVLSAADRAALAAHKADLLALLAGTGDGRACSEPPISAAAPATAPPAGGPARRPSPH